MIIRSHREFGEIVRRARLQQNLRQIDLAARACVRQALISDIENGVTRTNLETMIKILAALELDLSTVPRRKANFNPTEY